VADRSKPRIDLRPGPFLRVAAHRLDVRSRRGFPVTIAWVFSALAFLGFLSIVEDVAEPMRLAVDSAGTAVVALLQNPVLTKVMWVATLMGDTRSMLVETLVAGVLLAIWGHPRRAVSVALLVLTGSALSTALKDIIMRPRPSGLALIAEPSSASFPSGHALAGLLLFGTLALMLVASRASRPVRWWGAAVTLAVGLAIGVSRVYLGVHYASDVLASWCLGATMVGVWAAAVLAWGREVVLEPSAPTPVGSRWWRWTLTVAGPLVVILTLLAESAITPLR
jgi:undecaprenyl-diphosphatase